MTLVSHPGEDRSKARRAYGPVLSRRFGISLGLDLVPFKVCTFDCVYCQVGRTTRLTTRLIDSWSVEAICEDLRWALSRSTEQPEVITLAGSGEPTLYRSLPALVDMVKEMTEIPIALLTNGSLLSVEQVAEAAMRVDVLSPSLDAGEEDTFVRVNRPHPEIDFVRMLEGIADVSSAFKGRMRLEVMLVRGVNDSDDQIEAIGRCLGEMRLSCVDLNTAARPVPGGSLLAVNPATLERARSILEPYAKGDDGPAPVNLVTRPGPGKTNKNVADIETAEIEERIRDLIARRPVTRHELTEALGLDAARVDKVVMALARASLLTETILEGRVFLTAPDLPDDPDGS